MKSTSVRKNRKISGYSLIELVVVIFILVILFGLGMASYRENSSRKNLDRAVEQVRSDLQLARQYANSGKKPEQCDVLQGVGISKQGGNYQIEAFCVIGGNDWQDCHQIHRPSLCIKRDITFPYGDFSLKFVPPTQNTDPKNHSVIFYVLGRGTNASTTTSNLVRLRITDNTTGKFRDIVVTPDGRIE